MRLFVAICPSPEVRTQLCSAVDALRTQGSGRFVSPENLHLTLAFLGETDRPDAAVAALSRISAQVFSLTVSGIGSFSDLYWAGIHPSPELSALQQEVSNRLREIGFALEEREFIPHITLARRYAAKDDSALSAVANELDSASCEIREIMLMESRQEQGLTQYRPVFIQELR